MDVPLNPKKMRILLLDVQKFYFLFFILFFFNKQNLVPARIYVLVKMG